jgi:hypothetical protein
MNTQEQPPLVRPDGTPIQDMNELGTRLRSLENEFAYFRGRTMAPMSTGKKALFGGVVILGVSTVSILANKAWNALFPGGEQKSTSTVKTTKNGM